MLKNLKKTVEYKGKNYEITFRTFDVTFIYVNNVRVDIRTYEENLSLDELKAMITAGIEEYLKVTKPERTTKGLVDDFNKWDGKL